MTTRESRGRPAVPKIISGQKLGQAEFRERVVKAVQSADDGGADTEFVARYLGDPNWLSREQRWVLSMTLNNLERRGALKKVGRGKFVADEEHIAHKGLVVVEATERQLVEAIRQRGGFATLTELLRDYEGVGERNSNLRVAIKRALGSSKSLIEDPENLYRLKPDILATMPLTGSALSRLMKETWKDSVDEFDIEEEFARIGLFITYALRRRRLGSEDVLRLPEMDAFTKVYYLKHDEDYADMAAEISDPYRLGEGDIARRMAHDGASALEIAEERRKAKARLDASLPKKVLLAFLEGKTAAHMIAPFNFYVALGRLLELDAAQLSRGISQPAYADA